MPSERFHLADALTERVNAATHGLEAGACDLLDLVTPVTAHLLRHWFMDDFRALRPYNFHTGQRRALLNTIYAHEVIGAPTLAELWKETAPTALLESGRLAEVSQTKHAHPKYCLKLATGTGKTWVLQALLVWQLLNKKAAPDDPRFTKNFLLVAPGLIVYDRLLDAFKGKLRDGFRDFETSDVFRYAELFIPEDDRETVFGFVRNAVCEKHEVGLKTTGGGLIAVTNWHQLQTEEEEVEADDEPGVIAAAAPLDPVAVVKSVFPLAPGTSAGNSLETLDARFARAGRVLDFLAGLLDLMVFNDEAHHIHEVKNAGDASEVEWQKSLTRIAEPKGERFVQVDFSATPYNAVGSGKKARKVYFPHIIADFDLATAMRAGLVKSLALDKRKELMAHDLDYNALRDEDKNVIGLSEGQRVMLRAGLTKLRRLERDFAGIDAGRHPKMLVVCEDTTVSQFVVDFIRYEGLGEDEVMRVDSNKKGELKPEEWNRVREKLFAMDSHAKPRVIVSVLMLREGFDVNNVCVLVPLRSAGAPILLEQLVGLGLRLMWRESDYTELKRETRERIRLGKEPDNLLDVLSIVEHPKFEDFYDELKDEGLVGETGDDDTGGNAAGDLIMAGLREGFEAYDFALPMVIAEAEEVMRQPEIDLEKMEAFTLFTLDQLRDLAGKGDQFVSKDWQNKTLYGAYVVNGAVMNVESYNDYLARLTRRIGELAGGAMPNRGRIASHADHPVSQTDFATLAGHIDAFVREGLFGVPFNPFENEDWRVLLADPVVQHIAVQFGRVLREQAQNHIVGEEEVRHRRLSEVTKLPMRESASLALNKCPYERLGYSAKHGGLEKAFMEWADTDASVAAFCKISETKHLFVRFRYLKDDGIPALYSPDFFVRTANRIYLVETKSQEQMMHPNVRRKLRAAVAWCAGINRLPAEKRAGCEWHYALIGEESFYAWRNRHAQMDDLLDYARIRPEEAVDSQLKLGIG